MVTNRDFPADQRARGNHKSDVGGESTIRARGSRIIDTEALIAKGWPVVERGRHRQRRGKTPATQYLTRLPTLDFPGAPVVMALLSLLAGIVVIAVGVLLLALLMLAALQLVGTL